MFYAYARASTADQVGPDKTTIDEQINRCRTVAQLKGSVNKYNFHIYTDKGVSGSILLSARPAGREMLDQVKRGDLIIASKLDRIFRSAADALASIERLSDQGVGLILCDLSVEPVAESPCAKLMFTVLSGCAEFERMRIRERVMEGKLAKKAKGGHIGGSVPIGYKKVGENAMLEKDEKEQTHLKAARELSNRLGRAPAAIAREMAKLGMLDRKEKPYGRYAIWRMLK